MSGKQEQYDDGEWSRSLDAGIDPFPHAVQTLNYGTQIDGLSDVTRVEVIDNTGRPFARWYAPGVIVQVQDDGRTLKVFAGKPQERKRR